MAKFQPMLAWDAASFIGLRPAGHTLMEADFPGAEKGASLQFPLLKLS